MPGYALTLPCVCRYLFQTQNQANYVLPFHQLAHKIYEDPLCKTLLSKHWAALSKLPENALRTLSPFSIPVRSGTLSDIPGYSRIFHNGP